MKEENQHHGLSEAKRYKQRALNQLAVGFIIALWGSLLALKQVGIIQKDISTWSFPFITFGVLLIFGSIYRLHTRKIANTCVS